MENIFSVLAILLGLLSGFLFMVSGHSAAEQKNDVTGTCFVLAIVVMSLSIWAA